MRVAAYREFERRTHIEPVSDLITRIDSVKDAWNIAMISHRLHSNSAPTALILQSLLLAHSATFDLIQRNEANTESEANAKGHRYCAPSEDGWQNLFGACLSSFQGREPVTETGRYVARVAAVASSCRRAC